MRMRNKFHVAKLLIKMASNSRSNLCRRCSFEDIISIIVDQNFTMNAIGIVLESL